MPDVRTVSTLAEYIGEVSKIRSNSEAAGNLKPHEELWFRGEPRDYGNTSLSPKVYRPEHGKPRINVDMLLDIDNAMYDEFTRRAVEMQQVTPDDGEEAWTWYYMMQHYGAPTRLLDWSDGALMALHFAINGNNSPVDSRVFVLNSYLLDNELETSVDAATARQEWADYLRAHTESDGTPEDWYDVYLPDSKEGRSKDVLHLPDCPIITDPDTATRRFAAQRSRFMLFGRDPEWLLERHTKPGSPIIEIHIVDEHVLDIRRQLRDAGVTESVIFPDLDGLGREMVHVWEARRRVSE